MEQQAGYPSAVQTSPVIPPKQEPSAGQVVMNQPIMATNAPGQPFMAMPATGQPMMYQMPQHQAQPVYGGQPTTSPQGQPVQYYSPATGHPVSQQIQTGQTVQPVPQQDRGMARMQLNKDYFKSKLGVSRTLEFACLLIGGSLIMYYTMRTHGLDEKANFFRGVTIFCWVMIWVYQFTYAMSINKTPGCLGRPSNFTIISLIFQLLMTILMIWCTASLTVGAQRFNYWFSSERDHSIFFNKTVERHRTNGYIVYGALAFGYIIILFFLDDIRLLVMMFRQERAQEAQLKAQQPVTFQQQQFGVVTQPTYASQQVFHQEVAKENSRL